MEGNTKDYLLAIKYMMTRILHFGLGMDGWDKGCAGAVGMCVGMLVTNSQE